MSECEKKFYVFEVIETSLHRVMVEAESEEVAKKRFNNIDLDFTDDSYVKGDLDYDIGWIYDESELSEEAKNGLKTSKEGWRYLC